jgi:hypothetical protein
VPILNGYSPNFDLEFSYCRLVYFLISVVVVQLAKSVKFKFLIALFWDIESVPYKYTIQFKPYK